ncbi:hypothetical protein V8F44DRAFT_489518 [Aspergillus fumigatus]
MRFHVFLTSATTLFVAVLSSPMAETNVEYRLGYKEKCASDGSLGWCMPGYYCKQDLTDHYGKCCHEGSGWARC